jgi:hypothetical protein
MTYNDREGNSVPSLKDIARMLGGQISGDYVLAPGPGHSTNDRSLKVSLGGPDGFLVHSFAASDDAIRCKDYVRERCGMAPWEPHKGNGHGQRWGGVTAEYIYRDADGNPYLRVQRTAEKKFWQHHWAGSGWQKGAPRGPRIPYRLPLAPRRRSDQARLYCRGREGCGSTDVTRISCDDIERRKQRQVDGRTQQPLRR